MQAADKLTTTLYRRARLRRCPYLRLFQRYLRPHHRSQVRQPTRPTWAIKNWKQMETETNVAQLTAVVKPSPVSLVV